MIVIIAICLSYLFWLHNGKCLHLENASWLQPIHIWQYPNQIIVCRINTHSTHFLFYSNSYKCQLQKLYCTVRQCDCVEQYLEQKCSCPVASCASLHCVFAMSQAYNKLPNLHSLQATSLLVLATNCIVIYTNQHFQWKFQH